VGVIRGEVYDLAMRTRSLGASGIDVPVVVFGAWAVGGWGWGGSSPETDRAAVAALRRGLDLGLTAIDTAPVYGFGHSEELVAQAIAGRRQQAIVMTKAGLRWDDPRGKVAFEGEDDRGVKRKLRFNSRPDSVRAEAEASLKRLGIEAIDLLQIHWPDPTTPIADTMGALLELQREGKVRAIGVSNYSVDQMEEARRALGGVPLASDQPRYSLVRREIEKDVLPYARETGVGLLVYSPLEQGLLTGKVPAERQFTDSDGRKKRATFRDANRAKVNAVLARDVAPIAAAHKATLAQTALAWTLAQPGVTAVIAGARTVSQVEENAAAGDLVLTAQEWSSIDRAFSALELDLEP
jgi:aryl-alcohol dehydrogenase-like predicted oxidoreductase